MALYKTHPNFDWSNQEKNTNIENAEINTMNIINDNTFNLNNSLLNNDNSIIKVNLKSREIGVTS